MRSQREIQEALVYLDGADDPEVPYEIGLSLRGIRRAMRWVLGEDGDFSEFIDESRRIVLKKVSQQ